MTLAKMSSCIFQKAAALPLILILALPSVVSSQPIKMTIATGGVNPGTSLPFIAQKENLFVKHGLDVNIVNAPTPGRRPGNAQRNHTCFDVVWRSGLADGNSRGRPAICLNLFMGKCFSLSNYRPKGDYKRQGPKGENRPIGVPFGTAPHIALTFGLEKLGLDADKDVKLVQMPKADWGSVLTQLERGDVHFAPFPPPLRSTGRTPRLSLAACRCPRWVFLGHKMANGYRNLISPAIAPRC